MNKFSIFILGAIAGCGSTLYIISSSSYENRDANELNSTINPAAVETHAPDHWEQIAQSPPAPVQANAASNNSLAKNSSVTSLIDDVISIRTENLFESEKYKDLVYLMRKDKNIAAQLRSKLLMSTSYEEKYTLVNLLAHDNSEETVNLVIDLIKNPNNESKQLGFELLQSMDIKESHVQLNQALLDATYYETNPELLTETIYRLSEKIVDDPTKNIAIERFQFFLAGDNNTVKARAIDGISQLASQGTIASTVKQYIRDADENIRASAVSAVFKLNPDHIDNEMISILTDISNNSQETENVRNIASAVLNAQQQAR
ncbi:MAG TPA: HEAT repeat domain-containing protein [Cellvibrio sp.]|nr:HEAT repeat domain-containing protein [Cellvibrio sp.]